MTVRVINKTTGRVLAERARVVSSFGDRFIGLMGRAQLPVGEALHLTPCNSIHTFFMRFPIDVLFLDARGRVLLVLGAVRPWRVTRIHREAHSVLELPSGIAVATGTRIGDLLTFNAV